MSMMLFNFNALGIEPFTTNAPLKYANSVLNLPFNSLLKLLSCMMRVTAGFATAPLVPVTLDALILKSS